VLLFAEAVKRTASNRSEVQRLLLRRKKVRGRNGAEESCCNRELHYLCRNGFSRTGNDMCFGGQGIHKERSNEALDAGSVEELGCIQVNFT